MFIKHSRLKGRHNPTSVEDIIVTRNDEGEKVTFKQCLTKEFEIKELGRLKYFMRIDVAYFKFEIFISQQKMLQIS